MKDIQELTPDAETFRRVWQRVMPDEQLSQIVVRPPGGGNRPAPPGPPPRPQPPGPPPRPQTQPRPPEGEMGEVEILRRMLRALEEGLATVGEIRRRRPDAWPLAESLNRSAAQVRSAWFLRTGQRWSGRPGEAPRGAELRQLLRRQYMWELEFSRLCELLERSADEDGAEIVPGLLQASRRRRVMIRNLLSGR